MEQIESKFVDDIEGLRLHYLDGGSGPPVLFLHGWPTSSLLWRGILPEVAKHNRVIALDLPGFGRSDKPADASYSFRFHTRVLTGFLDALGVEEVGLVVHDLGGPIGLYWACQEMERVSRLALLNTLVYPEMSWAVVLFVLACRVPGLRDLLSSPWGLEKTMRLGIYDRARVTPEVVKGVQAPFRSKASRRGLLKSGYGLHPKGFNTIAERLPAFQGPVRVVYGEEDRILPNVAKTMRRVQVDLPQAKVTSLPGCGHFLQEDKPAEIGEILAKFFAP